MFDVGQRVIVNGVPFRITKAGPLHTRMDRIRWFFAPLRLRLFCLRCAVVDFLLCRKIK